MTAAGRLRLVPLSAETLESAVSIGREIFQIGDDAHVLESHYRASLADPAERTGMAEYELLEYFVAWRGAEAVGLTGLYDYKTAPDEAWVGWFGIRPAYRGKRLGKPLIELTIALAQRRGRRVLRLWTTDHDTMGSAHHLYQDSGFVMREAPELGLSPLGNRYRIYSIALTVTDAAQR